MFSTNNTTTRHHLSSFNHDVPHDHDHDHDHNHDIVLPNHDTEQTALHLLTLLLKCSYYISTSNSSAATALLPEIFLLSTPFGSPAHRVAAYFAHSLSSLLLSTHLRRHLISPPTLHHHHHHLRPLHAALQSYNSLTPLIKFSHFTSNLAIYDAITSSLHGPDHVHVIDVDVMQGLQWPGFFHILSSHRPFSVKLTGFGPDLPILIRTGSRLAEFAGSTGIRFEFNPVQGKFGDLVELSQLGLTRSDSVVVVHWVHHGLYDVCGSQEGFIRVLGAVRPRLVTMVEQNLSKTTSFQERFVGALHYYSALFDALEEGLCRDSVQRHMVEHRVFGLEIRNVLGCVNDWGPNKESVEGRVESWAHELDQVGFETVSLSGSPATQVELLLGMFPSKGYTLMEENGWLRLGWKDLPLLTASAWQPKDYHVTTSYDVI